jgi:electron-transferring-flavoprotein dehydrogenase
MSEPEDTQRESMEFDVLIVGGGPSGLAAAIRLKQLSPDTSVCLIEKGSEIRAHIQEAGVAPADAARHAQPRQLCSQPRECLPLAWREGRSSRRRYHPGFAASETIIENDQVKGVIAGVAGIHKDGSKGLDY